MMVGVLFRLRAVADRRGLVAVAVRARVRAVRARHVRRDLSSGRHGDDVESATQRGRTLAFNGVCGNLGVSLAAGITAALTASVVLARRVPRAGRGLHRHRLRLSVVVPDEKRGTRQRARSAPDVSLSTALAATIFGLFVVVALSAGLVFNTISVALPKIVDERVGRHLAGGGRRLDDRGVSVRRPRAAHGRPAGRAVSAAYPVRRSSPSCSLPAWCGRPMRSGTTLLFALAFTMAAIYGQITVNDLDHRPLQRRCLARPRLCGALFPHLHGVGRRGVDDRRALCPRRLRPRARRHRVRRARLPDRRDLAIAILANGVERARRGARSRRSNRIQPLIPAKAGRAIQVRPRFCGDARMDDCALGAEPTSRIPRRERHADHGGAAEQHVDADQKAERPGRRFPAGRRK